MITTYYHTIKHLKLIQIYGQLASRFKKPKINLAPSPEKNELSSQWIPSILKPVQPYAPTKLSFLNQEKDISAQTIWFDTTLDKLWLYNLHYFDVINSHVTENNSWCHDYICRWINENSLASRPGWEPYPLSLRLVNWIKWFLAGNTPTAEMLQSLALQARYLSKKIEIHLLGNHILANAKALLFVGLFFTGKEANYWFKKGFKLFTKQLREQVLSDGGHFELSPMYHSLILEDILDVINLFKTYQKTIPLEWLEITEKMFFWLQNMCHQDGNISFFNDAALMIAPTLHELKEYQQRLLLKLNLPREKSFCHLADSGYCRMQRKHILLLADVANIGASYQPGHGHADTLSFELSLGQQRLIVNSGTSCYAENEERMRQRSSKAHNTLVVNHRNSSEIWKSFRVARRAQVHAIETNEAPNIYCLTAQHDGYERFNHIYHKRTWKLSDDELLIEDNILGAGSHYLELNFHIHPDINLQEENGAIIFYDLQGNAITTLKINAEIKIVPSTYHPEFNISIPNKKIVAEIYQTLPAQLNTSIKFKV